METTKEEKNKINEKIEILRRSNFKQQTLPACRPISTFCRTILYYLTFGSVFLSIGIILVIQSNQLFEQEILYDNGECQLNSTCSIEVKINSTIPITGPIYAYYQLDKFYQNHRKYVKSRNNNQLNGNNLNVQDLSDCDPVIKVSDLWDYQKYKWSSQQKYAEFIKNNPTNLSQPQYCSSDKNIQDYCQKINDSQPAIPCGLIAKSFFNDVFRLFHQNDTEIPILQKNIAWDSDIQYKFKNVPDFGQQQWLDMEDEHFIVWMRTSGLPEFRKLWGRINITLDPEQIYILKINNNYDVSKYSGTKTFVLATTNSLGGKNYFIAFCYIVVGALCFLFAFIYVLATLFKKNKSKAQ